jgi:hypothetical protein
VYSNKGRVILPGYVVVGEEEEEEEEEASARVNPLCMEGLYNLSNRESDDL